MLSRWHGCGHALLWQGVDLSHYNMLGIAPNEAALEESVREDVAKLRDSPLIAPDIKIYGFTYDVFVRPCPSSVDVLSRAALAWSCPSKERHTGRSAGGACTF